MDYGKIEYTCIENGNGRGGDMRARTVTLTLVGQGDEKVLLENGVSALRQRRIIRLTTEAAEQGCLLSYEELSTLLNSSLATIKRDITCLEKKGIAILLRGMRKKKNNGSDRDRTLINVSESLKGDTL